MSTVVGLLLATPAARPCVHRHTHEHGTRSRYVLDRCRCVSCRTAVPAVAHVQAPGYGRWAVWADTRPVRAHVLTLMDAGMPRPAVAAHAHVSEDTVRRLLDTQARRMSRRTAGALLDLRVGRKRPPAQEGLWGG